MAVYIRLYFMYSVKNSLHALNDLLEYINRLQQFFINAEYCYKCMYSTCIFLVLCLMLSVTHYAQYYAGIISGSLAILNVLYALSLRETIQL